jgi:hypothetical protein
MASSKYLQRPWQMTQKAQSRKSVCARQKLASLLFIWEPFMPKLFFCVFYIYLKICNPDRRYFLGSFSTKLDFYRTDRPKNALYLSKPCNNLKLQAFLNVEKRNLLFTIKMYTA